MDCLVINSFENFPTQPPVYTPYIVGLLKQNNINCIQIDLNLDVWNYLLAPEEIEKLHYNVKWKDSASSIGIPILDESDFLKMKLKLVSRIDKALKSYRDANLFFHIENLVEADTLIKEFQFLFYYSHGLYIRQQRTVFAKDKDLHFSFTKMLDFANDHKSNPFISIFSKIIKNVMQQNDIPKIILIEGIFSWQFPYMTTLVKVLKDIFPDVHVCFSGFGFDQVAFVRIKDTLKTNSKAFLGFDSIYLVRNDDSLIELCKKIIADNKNINDLPSLAIKSKLIINEPFFEQYTNQNIIPDFSDLPFKKYFSPYRVISEKFSNRCFWCNCNYCSINLHKGKNISLTPNEFKKRIENYYEKYGVNHIFLLDEAATSQQVAELSQIFETSNYNYIWSIRTRIDSNLSYGLLKKIYDNGCRELWIGLESVSPKVLKLMNKTDDPELYLNEVSRIIKNCYEIGIGLHFCLLFAFPGETVEDHRLIVKFFTENSKYFQKIPVFISFNEFNLSPHSFVHRNSNQFNIQIYNTDNDYCYMELIPFKYNQFNDTEYALFQDSINDTIEKINKILCPNSNYNHLWNSVTDTCLEMIFKTFYQQKNPFMN